MKIIKAFKAGDTLIPAGTELHFGNEGFGFFDGKKIYANKIPVAAIESEEESTEPVEVEQNGNASDVAEGLLKTINEKFPDGFTVASLGDAFGDKIDGNDYSIHDVEGAAVLIAKTPEDQSIEIYLSIDGDGTYKPTGEYHVASEVEIVATESFIRRVANTRAAKNSKK